MTKEANGPIGMEDLGDGRFKFGELYLEEHQRQFQSGGGYLIASGIVENPEAGGYDPDQTTYILVGPADHAQFIPLSPLALLSLISSCGCTAFVSEIKRNFVVPTNGPNLPDSEAAVGGLVGNPNSLGLQG